MMAALRINLRLFQIPQKDYFKFHKRRDFFISYDIQVLLGIISQCGPLYAPFQEMYFFALQFGQEENISGNSIERRVY